MTSDDACTANGTAHLRPRVYFDADVLVAAAASTTGASHIAIKLAELTVIEGVVSDLVLLEAERNVLAKLPQALPAFRALVRSVKLRVVPSPTAEQLAGYHGQADPEDLPHLVAACLAGCQYFLTHNTKHYAPQPGSIVVEKPGEFLERIRAQLARIGSERDRG